jgi:hypothetical protein
MRTETQNRAKLSPKSVPLTLCQTYEKSHLIRIETQHPSSLWGEIILRTLGDKWVPKWTARSHYHQITSQAVFPELPPDVRAEVLYLHLRATEAHDGELRFKTKSEAERYAEDLNLDRDASDPEYKVSHYKHIMRGRKIGYPYFIYQDIPNESDSRTQILKYKAPEL